ncbi:hypothetical protein LPJ78_005731, partial [Coemansia sp. RSA 989]
RTLPDEESEHQEAVPGQLPVGLAIRRRSNSVALVNELQAANERSSCLSIGLSEPPSSFIEQSTASSETDQSSHVVEPGSGTLSPQYTLVNSDRASMRVHTGSIRERYMQQIAAINEDDSDAVSGYYPYTTGSSVYQPQQNGGFMDGVSMLSGFSEDGASTARVRIATSNAYNALRIGPQPASLFSGYSGRITTSSDPGGLASPSSFYDMQFADYNDHSSGNSVSNDVVRSDVAVYSGASEDVKFPFLPDNMSEFSGPFIHSSAGAVDRLEDRVSDHLYPAQFNYQYPPEHIPSIQQQQQQSRTVVRRSKKLKKRAGTTPPDYALPSLGPSTSSHPWNHIISRHSSATKYRSASAATGNTAPDAAARQPDPQSSRTSSRAVNGAAIRPNAIMRFLKRIAPRN